MKHKLLLIGFITLLVLASAVPVWAENSGGKVQIGGDIDIPADLTLFGDSVAVFGDQRILGTVNGSAVTIFGDLELNGQVNGDAVTVFGKVILNEGARVSGDLVSVMGTVEKMDNVQIGGESTSVNIGDFTELRRNINIPAIRLNSNFFWWPFRMGNLVLSLLATVLIAYFFMTNLRNVKDAIEHEPIRVGIKGLLATLIVALGAIVLAITLIGIPIAVVMGIVVWIATVFGSVAIYLLVGERLAERFEWETTELAHAAVGSLLISLIAILPFLGFVKMIIGFLALGAVIDTKFGTVPARVR